MKLPDNLPPLPPVPPGFDRWEYRGTNYSTKTGVLADHWGEGESYWLRNEMKFKLDWPIKGSPDCHVIEAVRDEPEGDHLDCKHGCLYGHETGGWPNRVCPHGECWRNQQEAVEDQPVTGVEARVCADIAARQRVGIAKYGCTVEDSPDDMLRHAYEEALDLAVYLKAEIERRQTLIDQGLQDNRPPA